MFESQKHHNSKLLAVYHQSSLQLLSDMKRNYQGQFIDYIFTSTPYPGDKGFHVKTMDEYRDWFDVNISPWFDVVKNTGAFTMVFTSYRKDGDFDVAHMSFPEWVVDTYGLIPVNVHPWIKTNADPKGSHKYDRHAWEIIATFGMTPQFTVNRQRKPYSKKSEAKARSGNMRKPNVSGMSANGHSRLHEDGATLPNYIIGPAGDGRRGTPRVKGGSFPSYLPERFIKQYSNVGDIVLDPCCGRGTTLVEAERLGRFGIGCDESRKAYETSLEYIEFMRKVYAQQRG